MQDSTADLFVRQHAIVNRKAIVDERLGHLFLVGAEPHVLEEQTCDFLCTGDLAVHLHSAPKSDDFVTPLCRGARDHHVLNPDILPKLHAVEKLCLVTIEQLERGRDREQNVDPRLVEVGVILVEVTGTREPNVCY